jgi:hypothetical protein
MSLAVNLEARLQQVNDASSLADIEMVKETMRAD